MTMAEDFFEKFGSSIRVQLNWRRFHLENWAVEIATHDNAQVFNSTKLPWCLNKKNEFVNYDAKDAQPLSLGEINKWVKYLPTNKYKAIQRFLHELRNETRSTQIEVPSYALPEDQYLLLDGNHSLSALALSGLPFVIRMYVVRGPLDTDVLPDLMHFAKEAV